MTFYNSIANQEVLLVTLIAAGTLYLLHSIRTGSASKSPKLESTTRKFSGYSVMTLGVALMVLTITSGQVPAKEIFSIPSNGSYDYYQVDSSIQSTDTRQVDSRHSGWPGLKSNEGQRSFSFMDSKLKDSSLIIDPGYRVSLSHRIITVSGRIVWLPIFEEYDLLTSLGERESLDMGKLNRERLTGVYELAWLPAYESKMFGYN